MKLTTLFYCFVFCLIAACWFMIGDIDQRLIAMALLFTIALLATGIVMEYLAVLLFFMVMVGFKLAAPSVVFSGFASAGFWLVFSSMIIGAAIKHSGLAKRISSIMLRLCRGRYLIIICSIVSFSVLMAFLIPSAMGRVMLMVPILTECAERLGFAEHSRGRTGIILAGIFGTYNAGFSILPANLPNIIFMGALDSQYHYVPKYGDYLLLHLPLLGLLKAGLLIIIITRFFAERPSTKQQITSTSALLVGKEKRMICYLVALLTLWATDFIHHISPAWVALAVGIICLLPRLGIIEHRQFMKNSNAAPLFYVAGIISISAVLNQSGLGQLLANKMLAIIPLSQAANAQNFAWLVAIPTVMGLFLTLPGIPAVMTPLGSHLAALTHLPVAHVLMTQVLGFSSFLLPYQAPPILIAAGLANIRLSVVTKLCLLLFACTVLIVLPLDYGWWKLLGWF